jgi:hypothetical protein
MLKLLLFAPCQKIIVGQDNATSLISLMEGLKINVENELPKNAGLPMNWNILCLWHRTDDISENMLYEQKIESSLTGSDDKHIDIVQEFVVSAASKNVRNITEIQGFPIGLEGGLVLKLFLRPKGNEAWEPIAEFPVEIQHQAIDQSTPPIKQNA